MSSCSAFIVSDALNILSEDMKPSRLGERADRVRVKSTPFAKAPSSAPSTNVEQFTTVNNARLRAF